VSLGGIDPDRPLSHEQRVHALRQAGAILGEIFEDYICIVLDENGLLHEGYSRSDFRALVKDKLSEEPPI
jgi:hypothetical protein